MDSIDLLRSLFMCRDSFTVSMHSPNGMPLAIGEPYVKAVDILPVTWAHDALQFTHNSMQVRIPKSIFGSASQLTAGNTMRLSHTPLTVLSSSGCVAV